MMGSFLKTPPYVSVHKFWTDALISEILGILMEPMIGLAWELWCSVEIIEEAPF